MPKYFGSKEWANDVLRDIIQICKKRYGYTVLSNRITEVNAYIEMLKEFGYWWQVQRSKEYLSRMKANHKGVTKETKTKTEKKKDVPIIKSWQEWLNYLYNFNT